jgi:hypothetical protein
MTDPLENKADEPKRVQVDGTSVEQHSLKDRIELDRYLESKKAAKKGLGIRFLKIVPPGATE